jgi:predicted transposase/invertase (TIGR01784 family)
LPRTIIISIVNFPLFNNASYHSEFQVLEVTCHSPLTDKMALIFFELPKIPGDIDKHDLSLLWLALFRAETEEDLKKIEALGVPELNQAINAYHSVTASAEFREIERLREKAEHDEAQALYNAGRKAKALAIAEGKALGKAEGIALGKAEGKALGIAEGKAIGKAEGKALGKAEGKALGIAEGESTKAYAIARNMIKRKRPVDEIVEDTGLARHEVEGLYVVD